MVYCVSPQLTKYHHTPPTTHFTFQPCHVLPHLTSHHHTSHRHTSPTTLRVKDAAGYISFVLESILSKELFHSLALKPVACWGYLLWMDQVGGTRGLGLRQGKDQGCLSVCLSFSQANHGGIHGSLPPELKALGAEPSEVELVASPEADEESGKVQRGGPVCQGGGALHRNGRCL